jgi:hypothetical protein
MVMGDFVMFSQDYIIRLISQATAALATILGLRKSGQFQQALGVIDQTLEGLVGLSASLLKAMDDRSLLSLLTSQGRLDTDRLIVIADLFRAEGDVLVEQNRASESIESYNRALALYLEVALADQSAPEAELIAKIEALYQQLSNHRLPAETMLQLRAYYARLLELDSRVLTATPVSRDEAERHLQELDRRLNEGY